MLYQETELGVVCLLLHVCLSRMWFRVAASAVKVQSCPFSTKASGAAPYSRTCLPPTASLQPPTHQSSLPSLQPPTHQSSLAKVSAFLECHVSGIIVCDFLRSACSLSVMPLRSTRVVYRSVVPLSCCVVSLSMAAAKFV